LPVFLDVGPLLEFRLNKKRLLIIINAIKAFFIILFFLLALVIFFCNYLRAVRQHAEVQSLHPPPAVAGQVEIPD
jgi:hypothetical protein